MSKQGDVIQDSKGRKGIHLIGNEGEGTWAVSPTKGIFEAKGPVTVVAKARTAPAAAYAATLVDEALSGGNLPGLGRDESFRVAADATAYARGYKPNRRDALSSVGEEALLAADAKARNALAARRYRARQKAKAVAVAGRTELTAGGPITKSNAPRLAATPVGAALTGSPPTGGVASGRRDADEPPIRGLLRSIPANLRGAREPPNIPDNLRYRDYGDIPPF